MTTTSNSLILSNGMEFMLVPAGEFLMGSKRENKFSPKEEKPQHTVDISYDYWMARFPVTNEQYQNYVKAKRLHHRSSEMWGKDCPVEQIEWINAMKYCEWLRHFLEAELPLNLVLRLPTEAEWEKAARGIDGRRYPWGNEFDKNNCNTVSCDRDINEDLNVGTTPVGSYSPRSDSPYGCADMAGNVWEWTHSIFMPLPYQSYDGREDEKAPGYRTMRGGSYYDNNVHCTYRRTYNYDKFFDAVGFRICIAPPIPK